MTNVYTFRLLARGAGPEVLKLIVDLSVNGRTMKQSLLLSSLFICAKCNDSATKSQAYSTLLDVCRIPTHLFEFVGNTRGGLGSGWGRSMRSGISNWYNSFENNPKQLVYLITKYKAKHGWSHRDLLRLAHIKPKNRHIELILNYINFGLVKAMRLAKYDTSPITVEIKEFLVAIEKTGNASTIDMNELKTLIIKHELVKEHINNKLLGSKEIWECLLRVMPATAMLRNLGKMSNLLLLEGQSLGEDIVIKKLDNINKDPRIHPLTLFVAWCQYMGGQGDKGHLTWPVNKNIGDSLENAFFQKFGFVQPTHKKICIAVEHGKAMRCPSVGTCVEDRDVAAAVALSIARIETDYRVVAFADKIMCLPMDQNTSLLEAIKMFCLPFGGGIDCTLPIKWAVETKTKFDAFVVFTGSESFSGNIHFVEALKGYRIITDNEDVRVVVVGMSQNEFSIADPCDPRMLNIVGFDKNALKTIQNFLQTDYHIIKSKYSLTGERTMCQDFLYN
ncbi:RNA-binding protein RO60-like [Mytilus trossulus]|uniref:RNA-binding protein RO60-like n=1 Tax=Mytilus trossulus TaxID=6551 RepID=UPI0030047CC2